MLMVATVVMPATALNEFSKNNHKFNNTITISTEIDVPVWKIGDSWEYEIEYHEGNIDETMNCNLVGDLIFRVEDDTGDHYLLKATGKASGEFEFEEFGLKTTRFSTAGTEILVRKADLGLENLYLYIKGIFKLIINNMTIPIPIQILAERMTRFNPTWVIMPFPLYDGKVGVIDNTNIIQESSEHLFWGRITLSDWMTYWDSEVLYYTCYEEQITVPAGTFNVYKVSAEGAAYYEYYYRTYYAPEVGNFVKESIVIPFNPHYSDVMYLSFDLELISTNYTP